MIRGMSLNGNYVTMTADSDVFVLPEALKLEECQRLDRFLRETDSKNIQLDGTAVTRMGGMAAQLIAAHQSIRTAGGTQITVTNPSDGMIAAFETLDLGHVLASKGDTE